MKRDIMKKNALIAVVALLCFARKAYARDIAVYVNGERAAFGETSSQIIDGRLMLPARGLAEILGVSLEWNQEEKTVALTIEDTTAILRIDGAVMQLRSQKGAEEITLDSPPILADSRALIPVRALERAFGYAVTWADEESAVFIDSAPPPPPPTSTPTPAPTRSEPAPTAEPSTGTIKADSYSAYLQNRVSLTFPRWSDVPGSYLANGSDGSKTVIVAKDGKISAQTYKETGAAYELTSDKTVNYELPLFGGFLAAENNYFAAFGQSNELENDAKETIKIVKYDLSFNKISEVSITGAQIRTAIPFEAGRGAMATDGKILVFHTTRERYKSSDGLNHQSQLTLIIDAANMTLMNNVTDFQDNHVSHSFDQRVLIENGELVLLDLGDAYPRALALHKSSGDGYETLELLKIPGPVGANATGVSAGGLSSGPTNYLVVYNSIEHSMATGYDSNKVDGVLNEQRDVYAVFVPKNNLKEEAVKTVLLEKYTGTAKGGSIPKLLKVEENKFAVIWEEFEISAAKNPSGLSGSAAGARRVKYLFIDDAGNILSAPVVLAGYALSECEPVIDGGKIIWHTDFNNDRIFYSINLN
jgi:hypothetical protein